MGPTSDDREQQVEALAQELYEVTRGQLLERISESEFDAEEMNSFFLGLREESDRALAIVSFSYIDETLKKLIMQQMNPDISEGPASLFEGFGPLASGSARIKLAAALYWISPSLYQGLDLLRKIRNEFAHRPFLKRFDDEKITGYLSTLQSTLQSAEEQVWRTFSEVRPLVTTGSGLCASALPPKVAADMPAHACRGHDGSIGHPNGARAFCGPWC